MGTDHLWQQFLYHLKVKRRSKATIKYYEVTQKTLNKFLEEQEIPASTDTLTVSHLRAFLLWLEEQGLSAGGIHAHARAVRAVFNWGFKEELLHKNPAKRLELPSLPKERQPAVTIETMKKLLKTCKATEQPLRDTALVLTLFDTGLRVAELRSLTTNDLHFDKGLVRVTGKGNKERFVPIGAKAMQAVNAYVRRERKQKHTGVHSVFLSRSGLPLTVSGISIRLAMLSKRIGVAREHCAPHAFRRGFAVEFLRNGGDVFSLQQIMGHSSLLISGFLRDGW